MDRLSSTIYLGYVNVPKNSDNRFDICEPIFTEKDMEAIEFRKHHNKKHYGYKHKYKFRNKVIINGQNAKHTQKVKNGREYNYYYVKGSPYVNEVNIEKFVSTQIKIEEEKLETKIAELISDLAHELSIGSITKKEFDKRYKNICTRYKKVNLTNRDIHVEAYFKNSQAVITYNLN